MERRGYTLVELTVVIAVMGVTLGLLATSLQALLRANRRQCDEEVREAVLMRLDLQWRTDVHAAVKVSLSGRHQADAGVQEITFYNGDQSETCYRVGKNSVHREVYHGDRVSHRDTFTLGTECRLHFAVEEGVRHCQLVCLAIEQIDPLMKDEVLRVNRIRAALDGQANFVEEPHS